MSGVYQAADKAVPCRTCEGCVTGMCINNKDFQSKGTSVVLFVRLLILIKRFFLMCGGVSYACYSSFNYNKEGYPVQAGVSFFVLL